MKRAKAYSLFSSKTNLRMLSFEQLMCLYEETKSRAVRRALNRRVKADVKRLGN